MMPAFASTTDQTVAGMGPWVGSVLLADLARVVARKMDASVTLGVLGWSLAFARLYEKEGGKAYKRPVAKTKTRPAFSIIVIRSDSTWCTGSARRSTSAKIWMTE